MVSIESTLPDRAILLAALVVAASTALLAWVGGYGTVLYQVVTLGSWAILSAATSDQYADSHHGALWTIALIVNLLIFLAPATLLWLTTRRRWPAVSAALLVAWCIFYLLCLFLLFPAPDGS